MDLFTLWLYPIPASRCCFPQSITAECNGIVSIPGCAPAVPMCFHPPPLETGCCRSHLGQPQPLSSGERLMDLAEWQCQYSSALNISHRVAQIHTAAALQRAGRLLASLRERMCA